MRKNKLKNLFNIFSFKKTKKRSKSKDFFKKTKKDKFYKLSSNDKSLWKKRKSLKLKFNFKERFSFLRSVYIPYFFIIFILSILILAIVLFSPIFSVKYIEIIKKDNITDMNIAYKAVDSIRWKSIFSVDREDLLKKFKNYQENIKSLSLKLKFPDTIYIELASYKELFNVYVWWKNYLLLENWTFIPVLKKDKNLETLNVVNIFWENKFLDYSVVYNEKYVKKISEIREKLKKNIIWMKISSLNFYNIEREFHIKINNSTTLIFSLDDDISVDEQIKKIAIFNKDHKKVNNKDLVYIDLRIKDKIFLCERDEEIQCRKNLEFLYPELDLKNKKEKENKEKEIKK